MTVKIIFDFLNVNYKIFKITLSTIKVDFRNLFKFSL